jgi:hypothetical protein
VACFHEAVVTLQAYSGARCLYVCLRVWWTGGVARQHCSSVGTSGQGERGKSLQECEAAETEVSSSAQGQVRLAGTNKQTGMASKEIDTFRFPILLGRFSIAQVVRVRAGGTTENCHLYVTISFLVPFSLCANSLQSLVGLQLGSSIRCHDL